MPADDLTPAQAAELLQVDASTLRRWARTYGDHLSQQANAERRRYTAADLATLHRAKDLLRAGKARAEVGALLAVQPAAGDEPPAVALITLPGMSQELQAHRNLIQALAEELKRTMDAQETARAMLQENRQVIDDLRQQIADLKAQQTPQPERSDDLEALRAAQARQAAQLAQLKQELAARPPRPWWRRLFGRP